MEKERFIQAMSYLGTAYGKAYSTSEIEVHYDFLKDFSNEIVVNAIKSIIAKEKFLPKISDLLSECEKLKTKELDRLIDYMFEREQDKAVYKYWECESKKLPLPEWVKEIMQQCFIEMKQGQKAIANSKQNLLEWRNND